MYILHFLSLWCLISSTLASENTIKLAEITDIKTQEHRPKLMDKLTPSSNEKSKVLLDTEQICFFPSFAISQDDQESKTHLFDFVLEGVIFTDREELASLISKSSLTNKIFNSLKKSDDDGQPDPFTDHLKVILGNNAHRPITFTVIIPTSATEKAEIEVVTNKYGYFHHEVKDFKASWNPKVNELVDFTIKDQKDTTLFGAYLRGILPAIKEEEKDDGYVLVFDFDDTLKTAHSWEPLNAVDHHAFQKYLPIEGMPELLKKLQKSLTVNNRPPLNVYLGAAAWWLGPSLLNFVDMYYPRGQILLNTYAISGNGKLSDYFDFEGSKVRQLNILIERFPKKKFIYFGDNAISDAEVYASVASQNIENLKCIMIRRVPFSIPENQTLWDSLTSFVKPKHQDMEELAAVFHSKGIGDHQWMAFTDPIDLLRVDFKAIEGCPANGSALLDKRIRYEGRAIWFGLWVYQKTVAKISNFRRYFDDL